MNQLVTCNIGIDMSKADFNAVILGVDNAGKRTDMGHHKFNNTGKGFELFFKWCNSLTDNFISTFTMEFTGRYSEPLAHFLYQQQRPIFMVSPFKSKRFRESYDADIKTDDKDAETLAVMGIERQLKAWKPDSKFFSDLKIIVREKSALIKQSTMLKNRLHAFDYACAEIKETVKRLNAHLKFIRKQIREINKQIEALLKSDPIVEKKVQNVLTIPGIGLTTLACILAETDGFQKVHNVKQLAAYAGYKVTIQQSGTMEKKGHISKRGNSFIRHALHMPILAVIQCNKPLAAKYQALKARKAKPIIATTAIERKTLILMYSLYKNDKTFDENYKNTPVKKT